MKRTVRGSVSRWKTESRSPPESRTSAGLSWDGKGSRQHNSACAAILELRHRCVPMEAAYLLPPPGRRRYYTRTPNPAHTPPESVRNKDSGPTNRNMTRAANKNDNDKAVIILIVISVEDSDVILQCDFWIQRFLLTASCFTL